MTKLLLGLDLSDWLRGWQELYRPIKRWQSKNNGIMDHFLLSTENFTISLLSLVFKISLRLFATL